MKVSAIDRTQKFSFNGTTKIYALTDTHQETRKTVSLLSKIMQDSDKGGNILMLHAGDIGKGPYPTNLEVDSYIKLKEARPDIEIVMTMGNNDFGFDKKNFAQILQILKIFASKGIKVVCANVFNLAGKRPEGLYPYTIIERDGDRNFITGFCIDKLKTQSQNGVKSKNQMEVIDEILNAIEKENPDNVIIMNHDFRPMSQKIINYCKKKGINVDLLIEGHDHSLSQPNPKQHIYHPKAYSDSMYEIDLVNNDGEKSLENIKIIKSYDINPDKQLIEPILEYENESGMLDIVAKCVLNLTKNYSAPSSLGSFLADNMKNVANADVGFCSTGIIQKSLKYKKGKEITNYDIKEAISGEILLKTVDLNAKELKEIFDNALKDIGYISNNSKFLQCSNNIRIVGENNHNRGYFEIKQIYIDDEPLLDFFGNPNTDRTYRCAIDSFIANGGQGFDILIDKTKTDVIIDDAPEKLHNVLSKALKDAQIIYPSSSNYPHFIIEKLN